MRSLELKIPPLLFTLLVGALMWGQSRVLAPFPYELVWNTWISVGVFILGVIFILFGVLAFRQANTTMDPRYPQNASSVVHNGIYRFSRNPMYVGFFALLSAWSFYLLDLLSLGFLPLFILYMNRFQIIPEERFLTEKYGDEFQAYMGRVRRWL